MAGRTVVGGPSVAPVRWRTASTTEPVEGPSRPSTASAGQAAVVVSTSGVLAHSFVFTDLAASQALLQGSRDIGQVGVQMFFSGSIVGIAWRANTAITAGVATFYPFVAAEQQSAGALATTTGLVRDYLPLSEGTIPFEAGEEIDVRVTTDSSFAPTTVDVEVILYATFSPQ